MIALLTSLLWRVRWWLMLRAYERHWRKRYDQANNFLDGAFYCLPKEVIEAKRLRNQASKKACMLYRRNKRRELRKMRP